MVGTGCWFGKAEDKAKFYSSPSYSLLQLSMYLLASPCLCLHVAHPILHMPLSQERLCWSRWLLLWRRETAWEPLLCALWGECCSPCSSGLLHLFWPFRSMGSNSFILLCMQQVYFSVASNLVNFMCDPNRPHWVRGCSMVVMGAGGLTESAGCRFGAFPGTRELPGKVQNRLQANVSDCCPCMSHA